MFRTGIGFISLAAASLLADAYRRTPVRLSSLLPPFLWILSITAHITKKLP